ncbi:hypothetical protein [Mycolicibacterium brumae]|uniref:Uncharacterized protein n=1 Tax=Mycolicibacterium brumae TaxID=85968 RepID=A0A2G5PD38_9MYCO|nr:hypothetical protein [Mycolicibacterium brumae]MCV7191876.1 hypothetical protein [Mycolicibacterium brumae]PIB76249.1 hypothetical protein CQY22_005865 [Mycolicibacterium brumae]RWA15745.1 hypothetical protein MBRU_09340 [Mycolicibacterium brumae DSM 44177]UWW07182.1 hypothetical protein L2Z93_000176 [Mycolicibacterium brumae]
MRLRSCEPNYSVTTRSDDPGRVLLRVLGLTFAMSQAEAIGLATKLADVVETIKSGETHE